MFNAEVQAEMLPFVVAYVRVTGRILSINYNPRIKTQIAQVINIHEK
jgi:hypothetical protein